MYRAEDLVLTRVGSRVQGLGLGFQENYIGDILKVNDTDLQHFCGSQRLKIAKVAGNIHWRKFDSQSLSVNKGGTVQLIM